jgi:hypothetical protein
MSCAEEFAVRLPSLCPLQQLPPLDVTLSQPKRTLCSSASLTYHIPAPFFFPISPRMLNSLKL